MMLLLKVPTSVPASSADNASGVPVSAPSGDSGGASVRVVIELLERSNCTASSGRSIPLSHCNPTACTSVARTHSTSGGAGTQALCTFCPAEICKTVFRHVFVALFHKRAIE